MSFHSQEDLLALTRTAEYQEFLFNQPPSPGHFMSHMEGLSNRALDASMMEIFHGIAYAFQAYPDLHSVQPRWAPELDNDGEFHIRVALKVSMKNENGVPGPAKLYGYDSFPEEIVDDTDAFSLMLEFSEAIYPDTWGTFKHTPLATMKEPFTSIDQVNEAMHSELKQFLAEFEQWAMLNKTPQAPSTKRKPSL